MFKQKCVVLRSSSLDDFYFQQFYSGWYKIGGSGRKVSASLMQRAVPGPRTAIVDFRKPVAVVLRDCECASHNIGRGMHTRPTVIT